MPAKKPVMGSETQDSPLSTKRYQWTVWFPLVGYMDRWMDENWVAGVLHVVASMGSSKDFGLVLWNEQCIWQKKITKIERLYSMWTIVLMKNVCDFRRGFPYWARIFPYWAVVCYLLGYGKTTLLLDIPLLG